MKEDFKIKVIATGSKGNCYLVSVGDESLLLECGIAWKEILKGVDFNIRNIKGCLISHSHKDHCKAFKDVLNSGIPIYCDYKTILTNKPKYLNNIYLIDNDVFEVGSFEIKPFECNHNNNDGTKCECTGFLIKHPTAGKIVFATDTYYLKYKFKDVDHVLIECNYTEEIEIYNPRLYKSHMSFETLKKTLITWDLSKTKDITLIHLSEINSKPDMFKNEIEKLIGIKTNIAIPGMIIGG